MKGGGINRAAVGENGGALDGVLQFTDVSRPGIRGEASLCVGSQFQRRLAELPPEALEEVFRQQQHVFAARAERRNGDGHGGNAEVKVLTKAFTFHCGAEIFVGGRQDADVHVHRLRAADPIEPPLLEYAQQLGLDGERQLADLIEKNGAAVRQLHFADLARAGARVGPALVAEEFVLHQPLRNCGAIQSHKWLFAPRRKMMNSAGKEFFARAAFAQQQDGGIGCGHALDLVAGFLHGSVFAEDAREAIARGILLAEQEVFAQQFLLLRGALDQQLQVVQVHRLLDEVEGSTLHRSYGLFHRAERGN